MSEVYAETQGISGTSTEVLDEEAMIARVKDADDAGVFDEVAAYYVWEGDCRKQEQLVRDRYAKKPGHLKNEVPIWERDDVKDDDKFRAKLAHDYVKFKQQGKEFSPAALAVAFSLESATFFDDVKCDYLGASDYLGGFREISPVHNQSPFDIQFNYNIGVLNAYTPSGNILHIRETDDPMAKTRDQRQLVLAMNVLTREVKRYYPEDKMIITPTQGIAYRYDEMVTLQPFPLSSVGGGTEIGPQNLFPTVYRNAMEQASRQGLAKILYSGKDTLHFKREGYAETFESLHPIAELDHERYLLSGLARAAGLEIGERNVILRDPQIRPSIAA
jgi:hypothetical protein